METGTYQITNIGLKKQSIELEERRMNVTYEKKKKKTFIGYPAVAGLRVRYLGTDPKSMTERRKM